MRLHLGKVTYAIIHLKMAKKQNKPRVDKALQEALRKAYTERAKLFVKSARDPSIKSLIEFLGKYREQLEWPLKDLGISKSAFSKVTSAGVVPHLVFCHPEIFRKKRNSLMYYRTLAALSSKGLSQLISGTPAADRTTAKATLINSIISEIADEMRVFDLALARAVIPLEIGAETQGTWVNIIGRGAAANVKCLITEFAEKHDLIESTEKTKIKVKRKKKTETKLALKKGWTIVFGDEPDVSIRDRKNVLRVAIEIKGSMDRAGAQTRYGEAKKSFGKAIGENAKCETIYRVFSIKRGNRALLSFTSMRNRLKSADRTCEQEALLDFALRLGVFSPYQRAER